MAMNRFCTSLLLLLAFVSGAAALVYEVVFFRSLGLVFGVAVHAIAAVVGSFLLGLGAGARFLGPALGRHPPLKAYAALEALIALFGYASPFLFRGLRHLAQSGALPTVGSASFPLLALVGSFLVLAIPTFLMGATFPVLGRAIAKGGREGEAAEEATGIATRVGWLYGVNTLGACGGALLASYFALPRLGLLGATHLAAGLNIAIAIAAFLLASNPAFDAPMELPDETKPAKRNGEESPYLVDIAFAVGAIGFTAIALQVLANRILISLLGGTVYVFGAVLAVFLLGIAIGGAFGGELAERSRAPRAVLACLALAFGGAIGFGIALIEWKIGGGDVLAGGKNIELLEPGEHLDVFTPLRYLKVTFKLSFLGLFLATALSGAFLPAAIRVVCRQGRHLSGSLGRLYLWNTIGSIAGSLAAAFVLLPMLGLRTSLFLLVGVCALAGAILFRSSQRAKEPPRGRLVAAVAALFVLPGSALLKPGVDPGAAEGLRPVFYREATASAAKVYEVDDEAEELPILSLMVSGKAVATSIFIDRRLQLLLGFVSTLTHRDPQDLLCIGLGTGMTSGALAVAGGELTVVEISDAVIDAAREFASFNAQLHERPDVTILRDDGRSYLTRCGRTFDVISADPIDPCVSGSAYLYTQEYYRLGRDHLRPAGMMSQWIPLYDLALSDIAGIVKTFRSVFPHVTAWVTGYDMVLLGSDAPIELDPVAIEARIAADPTLKKMLESVGVRDAKDLVACCFVTDASLAEFERRADALNTDEHPWIEFHAPLVSFGTYPLDVYDWLAATPDVPPLVSGLPLAVVDEIATRQRRLKALAATFVADIRRTGRYGQARTSYIESLRNAK